MERTAAQVKLWRAVQLALRLVARGEIWKDEFGELWKRRANGTWLNISDQANRGSGLIDGVPKRLGATPRQICVWLDTALLALLRTGEVCVDKDSPTACSDGRNRYRVQRVGAR